MIRVNVFVQVEVDKFAQAVAAARLLAEASQKETGCIAYDVFTSVTRPDVFMICETWADQAAIDRHDLTDHFKTGIKAIQELGKIKVEKFEF